MFGKRLTALFLCLVLGVAAVPVAYANSDIVPPKEAVLSGLYEADIATIQEALTLGLITSTELTDYYLKRIKEYNKPYNCFITLCEDALLVAQQRDEARARGEAHGALFGLPVVIKDNMNLAGYHTTNGYKKTNSQIADSNAQAVQALLDAGAVIIGKANMSTAAQDATCSKSQVAGETKNAYNTTLASGGSSGGSAVAVSLNFAAAALGTDTNSSLRIPAALNGCITLRPTFGLLSNSGIKRLNSTRDTPGAITRTVYDQAIMLDILTEGQFSYTENLNKDVLQGLRIGILEELSYPTKKQSKRTEENIDQEVSKAFSQAVSELESLGAEVVSVSFPELFSLSQRTFSSGDVSKKLALYEAYLDKLQEYNVSVLIYPSYLSTPIRSGKDDTGKYWNPSSQTNLNNCRTLSPSAGLPELTLPIGTHSLGAGIGLEIAAPKNCEQLLLDIAYAYTSIYDHRTKPEGAPDRYLEYTQGTLRAVIADYQNPVEENQKQPTQPEPTQAPTMESEPEEIRREIQPELIYWLALLVVLVIALIIVIVLLIRSRLRRKQYVS